MSWQTCAYQLIIMIGYQYCFFQNNVVTLIIMFLGFLMDVAGGGHPISGGSFMGNSS